MKLTIALLFFPLFLFAQWDKNQTPTYPELIDLYKELAAENQEIQLFQMGASDTEYPIYLVVINGGADSIQTFEKARNQTTILINNAIHAGEPDGVNACLLWINEWIRKGKKTDDLPVIAIIPAYNIGGMLNRSSMSRANQDGPQEYGFRGNTQNLDLNRDFIKMDSQNAKTFAAIYQALDPDVFVDTHVSNGADYQYTLTLIHSMRERTDPALQNLMDQQYLPALTASLKKKGWDWSPYVETMDETPESGLQAFNDLPRYAQGYGSLFHALSVTIETHMLKPFPQRVRATKDYLDFLIRWTQDASQNLEQARSDAFRNDQQRTYYPLAYQLTARKDSILFKGFQYEYKPSLVTGEKRLFYDRTKPYTKYIPYYRTFVARDSARIPEGYYISAEATALIERLKLNGVEMQEITTRTDQQVIALRIQQFESGSKPYEGHYLHQSVEVLEQMEPVSIPKGSVWIPTGQPKRNFIVSVLEPESEDSYFAWNFMDSYLQEKEYFSAYVFEDVAAELLEANPELKEQFLQKKKEDAAFAKNPGAQLFFIYQNSPYFESRTFNRLPVFKVY